CHRQRAAHHRHEPGRGPRHRRRHHRPLPPHPVSLTMRKLCSSLLFILALGACGPHGCPLTAHCDSTVAAGKPWSCPHHPDSFGGSDEPCDGDTCDPGLTCAVGTCVPCGIEGDACCGASEIHGGTCGSGLTCAYDHAQDWYTCQGCGATLGGACCAGETCGVGMCM